MIGDLPQDNTKLPPITIDQEFKRQSRRDALTIAMQNKPSPYFDTSQNRLVIPPYNVIDEAKKIYDWLITDL